MVSWASQAPLAYWKKSTHALVVVSIHAGSTTRSGTSVPGAGSAGAGPCAAPRAVARTRSASTGKRPADREENIANRSGHMGASNVAGHSAAVNAAAI